MDSKFLMRLVVHTSHGSRLVVVVDSLNLVDVAGKVARRVLNSLIEW